MRNDAPPASTSLENSIKFFASSTPTSNTATPFRWSALIFPTSPSNRLSESWLILDNLEMVYMTSPGETGLPPVLDISMVARPPSPVKRDLLSIPPDLLDIAAKHLATMSSADSSPARRLTAASLKYLEVSSGTVWHASADVLEAATNAASLLGGPANSNLNPCPTLRSILTISLACRGSNKRTEVPFEPARPVRPDRWT